MDELQREVIIGLKNLLITLGSANDAEDHGYSDDADRMRQETCNLLQILLTDHAFLGELFPSLEWELKSGHILNFGWSNLGKSIEAELQSSEKSAG